METGKSSQNERLFILFLSRASCRAKCSVHWRTAFRTLAETAKHKIKCAFKQNGIILVGGFKWIVLCMLSILTGVSSLAQEPVRRYDGTLRENDLRIRDLRKKILAGQTLPKEIRLRFSRKKDIYVIFYDRIGHEVYFRYKEDRFDDLSEKKLPILKEGQAYGVHGTLLGILLNGRKFLSKEEKNFKKEVSHASHILVFQFQFIRPLLIERLLF